MSETKKRLEAIEAKIPRPVVLTLDNGKFFHYPAGPLKLFCEILGQIYERDQTGKEGPLLEIVRRATKSEGFGTHMLEMAKTCMEPSKR
jgi:hypothetical protein